MADDDDFDLDGALEQSLAQMEENDQNTNNNTVLNIAANDNVYETKETDGNETAADDVIMQEALNAVQQSINNANDAQSNSDMMNDDEMKDFFNEIFKSFSNLDDDADDESLDKALKKVMTQFFDSNQLKEPVSIICDKYPFWLEENKPNLTEKEYENYRQQCALYRKANILLTAGKPDTSKIMDILLKTFSYGSLPPAVMDGMMPDELKQFADQMAQFEKEIDTNIPNTPNTNASNNESADIVYDNKEGDGNINTNKNNNGNVTNNNNDDMNSDEAMKFFQQLMGMKKNGNTASDDQKDNDFMPNLNDLPKLNEAEMQQFKQLMNQDGCLLM